MKRLVLAAMCIGIAASAAQAERNAATRHILKEHMKPGLDWSKPAAGFAGQHFTNALGCTYSRTQAPGYPPVWYIQVNTRRDGCPTWIPG